MSTIGGALALLTSLGLAAACSSPSRWAAPGVHPPVVSTKDVTAFVAAYHQLSPSDTICGPLREYFRAGSPGLRAYASKFNVGPRELCAAIHHAPDGYVALEAKLVALDSVRAQVERLFARFSTLYPQGRPPDVYFVVGTGISAGTTTRGRAPLILIGMERNGSVDRLAPTIAHEFVHTQQNYPLMGSLTGGPKLLRGSLLRHVVMEGSADFIAELVTGEPHRNEYGEAHEAELWRDFQRDMHGKDYGRWLWNGWNAKNLGGRPPDLGYYIGYRIAQRYYEHSRDKAQALRDILSIRDFDQFLAASGYAGVR